MKLSIKLLIIILIKQAKTIIYIVFYIISLKKKTKSNVNHELADKNFLISHGTNDNQTRSCYSKL